MSYSAPVQYSAPVEYSTPMIHSESPAPAVMESGYRPGNAAAYYSSSESATSVDNSAVSGSVIDGTVINGDASYGALKPTLDDDAALLTVAVPVEGARVTVNGHETTSDGMVRQFMSRGLKEGYLYTYEVVVSYDVDGREMKDTKTIKLRPGDMERMVFNQTDEAAEGQADSIDENQAEVAPVDADTPIETVVQLSVPADATVTLAGNETNGFGELRTFRTTQLAPGQSWDDYTVSVSTTINGRRVSQSRTIDVDAGSVVELEFDEAGTTLAMR